VTTSFPGGLDSLTNPSPGDPRNSPSHSAQHANANDAVEALEAKVGVDGSGVAASHDKQLTNLVSHNNTFHADVVRSVFMPINDGVVLDGGTLASRGTAPSIIRCITLADAATSGAAWAWEVPESWVAATSLSVVIYHAGQTTTTGTVRWSIETISVATGANITSAGTTVAFTGASVTTADLLVKEALTDTGVTPAAIQHVVRINVRRLGADGADTYAASTSLLGISISYTANM
jgi:hypothetical protein